MALDSLRRRKASGFMHAPKHDLESLFYVLLHVCTYTTGPGCLRSHIPEDQEQSVCLNEWWNTFDRHQLARYKAAQLDAFQDYILDRLPSYWTDFHPVLHGLYNVLWGEQCSVLRQPNVATHDAFLKVLREARENYRNANEKLHAFAPMNNEKTATELSKNIFTVPEPSPPKY